MNKSAFTNALKSIQLNVKKYSPEILTGVGIAGMVGMTIMAVRATPKALKLLEEKKLRENVDTLHPVDVVKTTWKCYIPAAATGVTSAACLIKACSIGTRRSAALATAYNLSKTALAEYKEKVTETIGESKEQSIVDKIAKDKLEKDPVEKREFVNTPTAGPTRCYDGLFGRCFYSSKDEIDRAIIRLNRRIATNMYVSLNELYFELGLPSVEMGEALGWNFDDGEIQVTPSSIVDTDGTPCLVMNFNVAPKYNYYKIV